jgi:predicted exporter
MIVHVRFISSSAAEQSLDCFLRDAEDCFLKDAEHAVRKPRNAVQKGLCATQSFHESMLAPPAEILIIVASGPALGSWLAAALVVIFSLPFLLHRNVRFRAAIGGIADIQPASCTVRIYEYTP